MNIIVDMGKRVVGRPIYEFRTGDVVIEPDDPSNPLFITTYSNGRYAADKDGNEKILANPYFNGKLYVKVEVDLIIKGIINGN